MLKLCNVDENTVSRKILYLVLDFDESIDSDKTKAKCDMRMKKSFNTRKQCNLNL